MLIVAAVPLYLVQLYYRWSELEAHAFRVLAAMSLVVIWGVVVYGSFIEPHRLVVHEQPVSIDSGSNSLKLVVISDPHLGRYRDDAWLLRIVRRINTLEPDAVVILGDLVDGRSGFMELEPLRELQTRLGTYAVLGNTDYYWGAVDVRHAVERYNVEVLTNEWVRLGEEGPILSGLDDIWNGTPDWLSALVDAPEDVPVIMAVHNPDEAARGDYMGVELMIAGHTHGGQIRLPLIGPVAGTPTTIDRKYDQGMFAFGDMNLFITSGVGESGVRSRLLNPPEIVQLNVSY
jgi:hypothetical protein